MPFCDGCDNVPFHNAAEALDFAIIIYCYRDYASCTIIISHNRYAPYIILNLSPLIIDQDISQENILMNHHGKIPHSDSFGIDELPEFRSTFLVRYLITVFSFSSCSGLGP
jgi:hypothetical protein